MLFRSETWCCFRRAGCGISQAELGAPRRHLKVVRQFRATGLCRPILVDGLVQEAESTLALRGPPRYRIQSSRNQYSPATARLSLREKRRISPRQHRFVDNDRTWGRTRTEIDGTQASIIINEPPLKNYRFCVDGSSILVEELRVRDCHAIFRIVSHVESAITGLSPCPEFSINGSRLVQNMRFG